MRTAGLTVNSQYGSMMESLRVTQDSQEAASSKEHKICTSRCM